MEQPTALLNELISALKQPVPSLPPLWFYDGVGSALFTAITRLPAYYLTRAELRVLQENGESIAKAIGRHARVVELGSGDASKATALLSPLTEPAGYHPIDVSASALTSTVSEIQRKFPELDVRGLAGSFRSKTDMQHLFDSVGGNDTLTLFFPGSTIGNFSRERTGQFLAELATSSPAGSALLVGIDLLKDPELHLSAYNDPMGVTAAFNRNALSHINRRLDAGFEVAEWEHRVRWDSDYSRVEMWLAATSDQEIALGDARFPFRKGDELQTEYAHKWKLEDFTTLAANSGWLATQRWVDERDQFADILLWNDERALRR